MNPTLRQLRVFVEVYDRGSFSAAAKAVRLTQSAVSKLCIELEEQVGFPLFERSPRKVTPTYAAADLYSFACEMLGILEAARRSMHGLAKLERGTIKLAASPMMMYSLIAPAIAQFRKPHPGLQFELFELSTRDTVEWVVAGKVDFGIVSLDQDHPKLLAEVVYEDRMYAMVDAGHPLASRRTVAWPALSRHEQVRMRSDFSIRRTLDRIAEQQSLELPASIETGSVAATLGMVKAGLGLAILPGYVAPMARQLGLRCVRLSGLDIRHPLSLIKRWNARPSVAAGAFVTLLKERLQAGRPLHAGFVEERG
ncbi:MAG TPA: LysR substrate-binding domain-containing protein [Burkholderiaceae bacterium]|nr:LysR substrate-binding domain-containing protein [Burkholderiaceae bacterium]